MIAAVFGTGSFGIATSREVTADELVTSGEATIFIVTARIAPNDNSKFFHIGFPRLKAPRIHIHRKPFPPRSSHL